MLNIQYVWDGGVSFALARPPEADAIGPPASSEHRRPLVVPGTKPQVPAGWAAPGQFKNDEEQAEAILNWYKNHLPPERTSSEPNATIDGETKTQWHAQLHGSSDVSADMTADSTRDLGVKEHAEEDPGPPPRFKEIELIGQGDAFGYSSNGAFTAQDGRVTENGTQDQTVITGADGRTASLGPVAQGSTSTGKIAILNIDESNCSEMKGKVVFSDEILKATAANGIQYNTVSSEWNAQLEERQKEFEVQVEELASEPIPADLDQAYIDHFKQAWFELRGSKPSDYRRCVLKKLENKFFAINAAVLRVLLKNFPKAEDGASCVVFNAALERILTISRVLQLYGADPGDCPLADAWKEVAGQEIRTALKKVLAAPHTLSDLTCYVAVSRQGIVDLGDLADVLQKDLWNLYEATGH